MPTVPPGGETIHHQPSPSGDMAMILYRLTQIDKKQDEQKQDFKEFKDDFDEYKSGIETRLRTVEDQQARMSERLTLWNMGQALFTAIASAAAAIVGHRGP